MSPAAPSERNARIGAKIRRRRHVLDWDQSTLAERVGVHLSSVQKWEAGISYPARKLGKLEAVLGIELDNDEGTSGEPEIPSELMALIERMPPETQQVLADRIRRRLAGEPVPAAGTGRSGRHRRAPG